MLHSYLADKQVLVENEFQVEVLIETKGFVRCVISKSVDSVKLDWAMDISGEEKLFESLLDVVGTVVFVSHRFSTVRKADRIFVVERGRITASGSHDMLMQTQDLYRKMFEEQRAAYL